MTRKFTIKCQMSENQIESDVSRYFGFLNAFLGTTRRLMAGNETKTGSDKTISHRGKIFYVQYKSPTGLQSVHSVPLTKSKDTDDLQAVRRFRHENKLRDEPYSLCFPLRKPSKPSNPLQHNVLLGYEQPPATRAFYLAPTMLYQSEYNLS